MYTYGRKTGCKSLWTTHTGACGTAYLENDAIRVGVLLDKGADIFEFTYKPRDLDFMWQSPIEMRKPFVATNAMAEGAFHDYYYGGWQEVLPAAGWATEPYQGVFQGLHGEVSLLSIRGFDRGGYAAAGVAARVDPDVSVAADPGKDHVPGAGQAGTFHQGAAQKK